MKTFSPAAVSLFHQSEAERKLGEKANAKKLIQSTLQVAPDMPGAWYNLASDLHNEKNETGAVACLRRALELMPDEFHCLVNLGWNLQRLGRSFDALVPLRRATELQPEEDKPWMNLALAFAGCTLSQDAIRAGRRAVELTPDEPLNRMALAFALMLDGQWSEGLSYYEARFQYKMREFTTYPIPRWDGSFVEHLFVPGEQGFGDTLQFGRYLALAAHRCTKLTVCVQEGLHSLVKNANGISNISVIPMPAEIPTASAFCPMMSLPVALGLSDAEIPAVEPDWFARDLNIGTLLPDVGRRKIGIVWTGNTEQDNNASRSCTVEDLLELYDCPGIQLYSFQVGDGARECRGVYPLVEDLSGKIRDFRDTAALMLQMDAVVTICTSTAHLAGALGVPVHIILPRKGPHFVWGYAGDTTPWYPSAKLYRQRKMGEWGPVISEVAKVLRDDQ